MQLEDLEKLVPTTLNAALAAYAIFDRATQADIRNNDYGTRVPFSDAPIHIYQADQPIFGNKYIDACYVGEIDGYVILSFRGTLSDFNIHHGEGFISTVKDWLNDANAEPKVFDPLPGKVHHGFCKSLQHLQNKGCFTDVIQRLQGGNKQLIITGHSKGGGIVPIAAMLLVIAHGISANNIHPIMFEPARSGNEHFANAFHSVFSNDTNPAIRYEYQDDIVPHMPPTSAEIPHFKKNIGLRLIEDFLELFDGLDHWDYASVGTLNFIDWQDQIQTYPAGVAHPSLFEERMRHLIAVLDQNPSQCLCDHVACGSKGCDTDKAYFYKVITGVQCPAAELAT
ncbi:MAG: lipase family protein [Bacteroidota bacterium]